MTVAFGQRHSAFSPWAVSDDVRRVDIVQTLPVFTAGILKGDEGNSLRSADVCSFLVRRM